MSDQSETLKIKGSLIIVKTDQYGVSETMEVPNLVVNTGKNYIASRMASNTANIISHMAVGTGAAAAALTDTGLGTELTRNVLTSSTVTSNTVTYVGFFPAGVTGTLTEAGVFAWNGTANTLLCRSVFSAVNKGASDSITITWAVSIT